jgi:hypothetical protein
MTTPTTTTTFVVSKPSGVHAGSCVLGLGPTKALALEDAYGPKPWSPYTKRSAASACVREVTAEELEEIDWLS